MEWVKMKRNMIVSCVTVLCLLAVGCQRKNTSDVSADGRKSNAEKFNDMQEFAGTVQAIVDAGGSVNADARGRIADVVATGPEVQDELLAKLAELPHLRVLDLSRSAVTSDGMQREIPKMTSLETLRMQRTSVDDAAIAAFASLPKIKRLFLTQCTQITDAGLQSIQETSTLEVLDLHDCNLISDVGLSAVSQLTRLRGLKLYGPGITNDGIAKLSGLVNLESLSLADCQGIDDGALVHLKKLKKLRELSLFRDFIGDDGVAHLNGLTAMEKLRLRDTVVTAKAISELAGMKKLRDLDLSECGLLEDDAMPQVAKLTSLTKLNLWLTRVSDKGVAALTTLPSLEWLNLDQTEISDEGLKQLAKIKGLTYLHVGSNQKITDVGVSSLSALKQLEHLVVSNCQNVTSGAIDELKSKLPKLKKVDY